MKKDPLFFVKHIEECIEDIEGYMSGCTIQVFLSNKLLQDGVIRKLGIIGEAAKSIPPEFASKYPQIPWSDIAKTRDKLIHSYFNVDLYMTFDIVKDDLPKLKRQILKILKS